MKTNYTYNIFEKSPIFDGIDTSSLNLYADCYANKKCPVCGTQQKKLPKTHCICQCCKNTIYTRVSPFANQYLLLDKKGLWKFEFIKDSLADRRFIYRMINILNTEDENFNIVQLQNNMLEYNKTCVEILVDEFYTNAKNNATSNLLGLMRNDFLNIAYIKAKYDSTEKALEMYFVVLFLDILGYTNETICNNNGVINITSYTKHPELSFIAPTIINDIIKLLHKENYNIASMYETYRQSILKLPINIESDDILITWWKIIDIIKFKDNQ